MADIGMFAVDATTRTARGTLLPWDVQSRGMSASKTKPITFPRGSVSLPRDPMVIGLNDEHERFRVIGRATSLEDRPEGIYAEFTLADTEAADAWLEAHPEGAFFSAEVDAMKRHAGNLGSGVLAGAAVTTRPAFDGTVAGLFSLIGDEEEVTTDEAPAAPDEEPDAEPVEPVEEDVAEATATEVMLASKSAPAKPELTRAGYFKMIDDVMGGRASFETRQRVAASIPGEAGLFALDDITYDGVGGIGANMVQAQWLGEVLDGTTYRPRYTPLFGSANLTGLAMAGWKWGVKPAGGTWTGNKTEIPSNAVTLIPVTENATRWAGGNDIAREHRDFGTPGFFEAYNAAMRESFDRWLDGTIVLAEALAGATDLEADNPAGLDIGAGWSAVIDGAASIVAAGLTPTSAVVSPELWKAMAKIPNSDVLGYLNASLSLTGDGRLDTFSIVPAAPGQLTVGHVLVVSREAGTVYTLPGSPIRAEALNIANGGIDVGFFGYGGFLIKNAAGIVDVAPYTP